MFYDYNNKNYLAPIQYLISHYIYEYDISKAGLNILYNKGVIKEDEYQMLLSYPRGKRQVYVGMLQKDNNVAEILSEGVAEYRKKFIESNNIEDKNILSVKNDALFLIDMQPKYTKFENIEFKLKNVYTSFYKLGKLEVYYYLDTMNDREIIDIKGIKEENLLLHRDYMIEFICSVLEKMQCGLIPEVLEIISNFNTVYCNMELPVQFYREFNADSKYRIIFPDGMNYVLDTISEENKKYLNIHTNLMIIRELFSIVSNMYFSQ